MLTLQLIITIIIIGLIAGFIAGRIMKGRGFGLLGDLIIGILGSFLGGYLAGKIGFASHTIWAQIIVAILGACILLWVIRLFRR